MTRQAGPRSGTEECDGAMKGTMTNVLTRLSWLGSLPSDSEEEQLRKATLTLYMLLLNAAGIIWGAMYTVLG